MKVVVIDGKRFVKDKKTGYYLYGAGGHKAGIRLHRYIWEKHNGPIPEGCHIHHIDHDKENNDISNLAMMSRDEHFRLHGKELTEEQREWMRNNIITKAVPAARKWHSTEEGRMWHRQHALNNSERFNAKHQAECLCCGKQFLATHTQKFCSNKCKSKWRRMSGVDNEERTCAVCGRAFVVNRYSKQIVCSRSCSNRLKGASK